MEWKSRFTLHTKITTQHTSIYNFLFMNHIINWQAMCWVYLIINKISSTIEYGIVWLSEDIFWPFLKKCAMKGTWLNRNKNHANGFNENKTTSLKSSAKRIISVTLTNPKQRRKSSMKRYKYVNNHLYKKRPKGRTVQSMSRIVWNTSKNACWERWWSVASPVSTDWVLALIL